MSNKQTEDKKRPSWPWTPRQERQKEFKRLARKQMRKQRRNI